MICFCQKGKSPCLEIVLKKEIHGKVDSFGKKLLLKIHKLRKRKSKNRYLHKTPRKIGGNLARKQFWIWASYINIHPPAFKKGIKGFFPARDFLHLIQKQIGFLRGIRICNGSTQVLVHTDSVKIFFKFHARIKSFHNILCRNTKGNQFLFVCL